MVDILPPISQTVPGGGAASIPQARGSGLQNIPGGEKTDVAGARSSSVQIVPGGQSAAIETVASSKADFTLPAAASPPPTRRGSILDIRA
jgi:hypothetical protein